MKSKAKGLTITFLVFLVVGVLAFTAFGYVVKKIADKPITAETEVEVADLEFLTTNPNSPFADLYKDSKKINILVLALNTNLTDTMLLVNYDKKTQDTYLISLPRDTFYERDKSHSVSEKRLNAAYQGKVENTAKAVSDILCDIPINYYVVVDFEGIAKIVDAIGGVPMEIPFHMYYNDPYDDPPLHIDIPEGSQRLSGEDSVKFLRFRHGDPGYPSYPMQDLDRTLALQAFVKSAIRESLGINLIKIANVAYNNVRSNMTLGNLTSLLTSAIGFDTEKISSCNLPGTAEGNYPWYYYRDDEKIEALIRSIYEPKPEEEAVTDGAIE